MVFSSGPQLAEVKSSEDPLPASLQLLYDPDSCLHIRIESHGIRYHLNFLCDREILMNGPMELVPGSGIQKIARQSEVQSFGSKS